MSMTNKNNKRNGLIWSPLSDRLLREFWSDRFPSSFLEGNVESPWASMSMSDLKSNIWENDTHFGIEIAIPAGIDPKEMDIDLQDDMLTVRAEMKEESESSEGKNYHHKQIVFGSFSQSFNLPAGIDIDNVTAKHSKGILHISFPKVESKKAKKIQITE